jgi:hypothetical protein
MLMPLTRGCTAGKPQKHYPGEIHKVKTTETAGKFTAEILRIIGEGKDFSEIHK